ncbi:MAG: hypothetical protein HKN42_19520 [Granulosicoccus sp.]|nr:hypothetical protein [Granulosicoccus sp.]
MINRSAVILRYKAPAVAWINTADPHQEDPGITMQSVNQERTVYLISEGDGEDDASVAAWIEDNFRALFESEIHGWYLDESLWPELTGLKMFREWFDVESHSMIVDTVDAALEDDEL